MPVTVLCGGSLYAHIAYPRQLSLKSQMIGDAFAGSGGIRSIVRSTSPARPEGLTACGRGSTHGGRAGFYREGTHQLCDAAVTGQLRTDAVAAVERRWRCSIARDAASRD